MSSPQGSSVTMPVALPPREVDADKAGFFRPATDLRRSQYLALAENVLQQRWRRRLLFLAGVKTGDGATETAANLAIAMRQRKDSVLLVDLNLTSPGLWTLLGEPAGVTGFEDALRGMESFEHCVHELARESLACVMLRKPVLPDEARGYSGVLNDFLEWAEQQFDWMVMDCPPVLSPAWTRWFALNADPTVLVVQAQRTGKQQLRHAARRLGDRLAGAILADRDLAEASCSVVAPGGQPQLDC